MNEPKTIYGIVGQPVGTVEGTDVFDVDGEHIGFLEDDLLFASSDGECLGCYVNGVVYNAYGDAEGFSEAAKPGIPLLGPSLRASPPKIRPVGQPVRGGQTKPLPEFFKRAQGNRRGKVFP